MFNPAGKGGETQHSDIRCGFESNSWKYGGTQCPSMNITANIAATNLISS
jgi:hypothetical protein